eukprot:COSAG01_NODE_10080_length_2254_cov_2.147100_2_plen_98_part_00
MKVPSTSAIETTKIGGVHYPMHEYEDFLNKMFRIRRYRLARSHIGDRSRSSSRRTTSESCESWIFGLLRIQINPHTEVLELLMDGEGCGTVVVRRRL